MNGVEKYFQKGQFEDLHELIGAFLSDGEGGTTKIDGAPAILMWSEFSGLPGPGTSLKALIHTAKQGRPNGVFTSPEQFDRTFDWAGDIEEEGKKSRVLNRTEALRLALKHISPIVKPGVILWGDVLFTKYTRQKGGKGKVRCHPNTITYDIDVGRHPSAEDAELGIYIHTVVDENFNQNMVYDSRKFLTSSSPEGVFVLSPSDLKPEIRGLDKFRTRLEEANDLAMEIQEKFTPNIGKDIDMAIKSGVDIADEIMSDRKNKGIDGEYADKVEQAYMMYFNLKEDLVASCSTSGIQAYIDGKSDDGQEGYVVCRGNKALKLVSKRFTNANLDFHHSQMVNESVEGDYLKVWTSSKDSDLFNLYIKKMLTFGNSGGSNYGFASYAVIEPPFSDSAEIGYSKEFRAKIYGDNIFEFRVPTSKVLFLLFDEYRKTKQGRNAKFSTFVRDQVKRMGLDFTDEEIQYITPESQDENTATQAMRLYKLCSRKYYQNKDGTLKSPFAGFVYKGRMDGKVYVGWNPYALEPMRMSKDAGETWTDIDRNDPELVAYLNDEVSKDDGSESAIFDGNRTDEKEKVYRLMMQYNSNDGYSDSGEELRMSDGVFYDIVIHDDRTIDAKYRSNLPIADHYKHYYRPSQNQFIQKIVDMGWRFGHLDCGIKIGAETKDYPWDCYNIPRELLPAKVDGGLKLTAMKLDRPISLGCKFGSSQLVLVKCELAKDVFSKFDVVLTKNEKKLNWTSTPQLKEKLAKKYEWADSEMLLDHMPEKKQKQKKTSAARKVAESSEVQNSEEPKDSNQRVAVILTDGKDVLLGQALQHLGERINCCDLLKGHAQIGEDLEDAARRETWEECGLHITDLRQISPDLQYTKNDTLRFYLSEMNPLPDMKSLKCSSYFVDDKGRKIPEVVKFHKIPLDELATYVYRGLARLIVENGLIEKVKKMLNVVNEARAKKDPSEQVDDYIKSLSEDQIQTLTLRCSELLDKWNEPQGSDTILRVRQVVDNDGRFMQFLRKTVPLKEPKPRDMGAHTFIQHFFDPPFDIEAFIGKMAKEKGIPFVQAEEEWNRANLDKTHVGRYAHMLADDAVNGRPPSKQGENPKEVAVYTAIYEYAQNLVKDATDVESEVSLHAASATVGGKFDLLMKKNGVWTLVDWKTAGEDLDDVPTGKVGIDDLTKNINNNSYNKYALQLNVYEWAAKDGGKIPKDAKVRKELHHFQYLEDGKPVKISVVKVPDLQELVQAMVERAVELGVVKRK